MGIKAACQWEGFGGLLILWGQLNLPFPLNVAPFLGRGPRTSPLSLCLLLSILLSESPDLIALTCCHFCLLNLQEGLGSGPVHLICSLAAQRALHVLATTCSRVVQESSKGCPLPCPPQCLLSSHGNNPSSHHLSSVLDVPASSLPPRNLARMDKEGKCSGRIAELHSMGRFHFECRGSAGVPGEPRCGCLGSVGAKGRCWAVSV